MKTPAGRVAYVRPVQLQGLEAHVISQTEHEGKDRLPVRFGLCHRPLSKALPLFFPQACRGGSRATRGKRSLARKSLALF
jgi:hypothetical protein